jgi:hypothetical protein
MLVFASTATTTPPLPGCRYLLHHRPCSSALRDFTIGTFFNRVIDDGKASDNTRHMAVNAATGQPYLLPAEAIRRVVLCTGQIYYQLSRWACSCCFQADSALCVEVAVICGICGRGCFEGRSCRSTQLEQSTATKQRMTGAPQGVHA